MWVGIGRKIGIRFQLRQVLISDAGSHCIGGHPWIGTLGSCCYFDEKSWDRNYSKHNLDSLKMYCCFGEKSWDMEACIFDHKVLFVRSASPNFNATALYSI